MDDVAFLYNARFFARRHKLNWRIPIVCGAIYDVMGLEKEDTIADFGCAIGDLVQGFLDLGLTAHGFEGSDAVLRYVMCPKENFFIADLRKPINDKGFLDLGLTAHGFEGSDAVLRYVMCPKENFFIADLRNQ